MSTDEGRFEKRAGLTIAVFAAILAITDLLGNKYGDDEILGANERASAFAWYQAKSTKQSLVQHQLEVAKLNNASFGLTAASLGPTTAHAEQIAKWEAEVARYQREKKEILEGSAAVGPEGWALENDAGQKGQIIGANEWGSRLGRLKRAGDRFELGSLFLQLTLVLGAVSLVSAEGRMKRRYYVAMWLLGVLGGVCGSWGWLTASGAVP